MKKWRDRGVNITAGAVTVECGSLVAHNSIRAIDATTDPPHVKMTMPKNVTQHISSVLSANLSRNLIKTVVNAVDAEQRWRNISASLVRASGTYTTIRIIVTYVESAGPTKTKCTIAKGAMCA